MSRLEKGRGEDNDSSEAAARDPQRPPAGLRLQMSDSDWEIDSTGGDHEERRRWNGEDFEMKVLFKVRKPKVSPLKRRRGAAGQVRRAGRWLTGLATKQREDIDLERDADDVWDAGSEWTADEVKKINRFWTFQDDHAFRMRLRLYHIRLEAWKDARQYDKDFFQSWLAAATTVSASRRRGDSRPHRADPDLGRGPGQLMVRSHA